MTNAKKLREVFTKESIVVAPGVYDAFSSLIVQKIGFPVAYMGGFSISASKVGYPDWGFATMNEMLTSSVDAVKVLDIPVIADIDQGFGALTNFVRTINDYEKSGIAAVHFEDQPFPKKCSHQPNRVLISLEESIKKIKAAVQTRNDPDFMLIARTDAKDVEGLDGLKRRMDAYLSAGADYVIFCEQTEERELFEVGKEFPNKVIAFVGGVPDNPAWCLPVSAYEEMGYKGLIYPALGLQSAHKQMIKSFETLYETGHISSEYMRENITSLSDVQNLTKMVQWQELRDEYNML